MNWRDHFNVWFFSGRVFAVGLSISFEGGGFPWVVLDLGLVSIGFGDRIIRYPPIDSSRTLTRPRLDSVLMFDNGCTGAFVAGEQHSPAQFPWLVCWLEELERRGYDPAGIAITMPGGHLARPFRVEGGGWNWRFPKIEEG